MMYNNHEEENLPLLVDFLSFQKKIVEAYFRLPRWPSKTFMTTNESILWPEDI